MMAEADWYLRMTKIRYHVAAALCGAVLGGTVMVSVTAAETYTYVDQEGTVVFTDKRETIPPQYRARAKVVDGDVSAYESLKATEKLNQIVSEVSQKGEGFTVGGLTPYQSRVLVMGFTAGIVMLAVMKFTGNSALRLLMRWLLVLVVIGTTASIFFASEPLTQKAKGKTKDLERAQREQAERIEQMDPGNEPPR
jgi:preprotein translocase subunit SecF